MTEKLLPCPFCGGKADYCETNAWWVRCNDCNAETEADMSPEAAAEIWNRRFTLTSTQQPDVFMVGDQTMEKVFKPTGMTNLHDLQAVLDAVERALTPPPSPHVEWGDWTVDDTDTAREIMNYLGYGSDASREPGADRRRDKIAAMIRARIDAATAPAPEKHVMGAVSAIAAERQRQIGNGYDAAHDDSHIGGEIVLSEWGARARIEAAINAGRSGDVAAYKELLTEAAAQCAAEIERVERAEGKTNA